MRLSNIFIATAISAALTIANTQSTDGTTTSPCSTMCTAMYEPVCGSNGLTYSNACQLQSAACSTKSTITIAHQGECTAEEQPCPQFCPMIYAPVCGTDANTYSNACLLSLQACNLKSGVTVAYQGECTTASECDTMCTQNYEPVCGTDGLTYSNACQLGVLACQTKNQVTVAYQGECKAATDDGCPQMCTMEYAPVCGSDFNTYANPCLLNAQACRSKSSITIAHQGECTTEETCPSICPMYYLAICGSNGETFGNECMMREKACRTKTTITVAYQGECKLACNDRCTKIYQPVCGSNLVTYGNECLLDSASCHAQESGFSAITKVNDGECASDTLTENDIATGSKNGLTIGLGVGFGFLAIIAIIAGVTFYKRRQATITEENATLIHQQS
jgi:hypothetical protein